MQSTFSYAYNDASWGDLLTTVGDDDVAYDEIGNPTYIGYTSDGEIFDSAYELIWEGRQLVTHRYREYYYEDDIDYFDEVTYTYNADGIRTSKTVEGVKHEYILNGSQIIAETWTERGVEYVLFYFYDEAGAPLGIKYRTSAYAANDYDYFYFEKNLQGDIVAVYNESGTQIGRYYYDAWGNFTTYSFGSTGLERYIVEDYNPFRYRGYYYDIETGYYYLQSRYYNPTWGRFLTFDKYDVITATPTELTDKNLYAYCDNNPITRIDEDGEFWHILVGVVVGLVSQYVSDVATNIASGKTGKDIFTPNSSLVDYAAAAASGALAATGVGVVGAVAGNAAISATSSYLNQAIETGTVDGDEVLNSALTGAVSGLIGGKGANGKKLRGVVKYSKLKLKTAVSPKKIARYTGYITNAYDTVFEGSIRTLLATSYSKFMGEIR